MIQLEKRPTPSRFWSFSTPVLAIALTIIAGGLMFAALGKDPFLAIKTIFWDPLFGEFAFFYRGELLKKAGPLILIAIGLSLGFRAGIWNIGAEGQFIIGAITGAAVGLAFYPMESFIIFPLMVIAGALGGLLWAMIPGLLRVTFNTNEILVSLMLVYVAEQIVARMAIGPMRNPDVTGFPGSRSFGQYPSASNEPIFSLGRLPGADFIEQFSNFWIDLANAMHWGVVAAFLAVIAAQVLLSRHRLGFEIKLTGAAPRAARFSGAKPGRLVLVCMGISGALAGLAGLFEVTGPAQQIRIDFGVGYGFTAIIVAFLGRLNPIGILLAGLLMALTYVGGDAAANSMQIPVAAIQAFQGMLLFFLLGVDVLTNYRFRLKRRGVA